MFKRAAQAFACVSSVVVASYGTPVAANQGQCAMLSANPGGFDTLATQVGYDQLLSSLGRNCPQVLMVLGLPPNVIYRYIPIPPSAPTPVVQAVAAQPPETPTAPPVISESLLSKLKASIVRLNAATAAVDAARLRVDNAVGQVRMLRRTLVLDVATKNLTVQQATERRVEALNELAAARADLKNKQDALADAKEKTSAAVAEALGTKNAAAEALAKAVNLENAQDMDAVLQALDKQLAYAKGESTKIARQIQEITAKIDLAKADAASANSAVIQAKTKASAASESLDNLKNYLFFEENKRSSLVRSRDEAVNGGYCSQTCADYYKSQIGTLDAIISKVKTDIEAAEKSVTEESTRAAEAEKKLADLKDQISGMVEKVKSLEPLKQQAEAAATALTSAGTAAETATKAHQTAVAAAKTEVDAKAEAVKQAEERVAAAIKLGTDLTTLTAEEKNLLADLEAARAALKASLDTMMGEVATANALLSTVGKEPPAEEGAAAKELGVIVGTATETNGAGTGAQTRAGTATNALDKSIDALSAALKTQQTTPTPPPILNPPPITIGPAPQMPPIVMMAMVQDTETFDPQVDTGSTQSTTSGSQTSQESAPSDTSSETGSSQDASSASDTSGTSSDTGSSQDGASGSDTASDSDTSGTSTDTGSSQDSASGSDASSDSDTSDTSSDTGSSQDSASGSDTASET